MKDLLGDRMKSYEDYFSSLKVEDEIMYVRLDGRAFSKLTKDLEKPSSVLFIHAMKNVVVDLVSHTPAICGFTQSDEISLVYAKNKKNEETQLFFDGKLEKVTSVLAGLATASFCNFLVGNNNRNLLYKLPHFDCRVVGFNFDEIEEVINAFVWRWKDGTRNAIQAVAQSKFSAKQLHGKSVTEQLAMLENINVSMDEYPSDFRYGSFFYKKTIDTGYVGHDLKTVYRTVINSENIINIPELKEKIRKCIDEKAGLV